MTRYHDSHFIIIHNDSNKEIQSYSHLSSSLTWFSILGKELLAFLHPTIPHLESFYTLNLFHVLDIIFDVIVREILQILPMSFVCLSESLHNCTSFRASDQLCVRSTLALHKASSVADPPKSPSEQPDETGSSRISSLGLFVLPLWFCY